MEEKKEVIEEVKKIKEKKICNNCKVDEITGIRMLCSSCSQKNINAICRGFQDAFNYKGVPTLKIEKRTIDDDIDLEDY